MSKIILSEELVEALKTEIKECNLDLNIITGFCKLDTLKLINSLCSDNVNKKLLVRFLPSDLASGATDKEIYDYIISHDDVLGIDLLQTRIFGNKIYIDLEIEVDASYSLEKAHAVAEDVHKNIEQRFPKVKHIMIHVNPYEGEEGKC